MELTPGLKFAIIAAAFLVEMFTLAWTGIKVDVTAVGLSENVYNIVSIVGGTLSVGVVGLLGYLGIKAPTIKRGKDEEH